MIIASPSASDGHDAPSPRRRALGALLALVAMPLLPTVARAESVLRAVRAVADPVVHPEPRPGITAERVLADADIQGRARSGYEAARRIPEVLDGLYCHCDCGERDHLRSLLSCFETRMPLSCGICVGEATLALELHEEGKTLAEIREAVDAKYGG